MPRTYAYSNEASTPREFEAECVALDASGYVLDFSRVCWECSPAPIPVLARPGLSQLLARVRAGDAVVTLRLKSLGGSVREVLATIARFGSRGVRVYCVETGDAELTDRTSPIWRTLDAVLRLERTSRSARTKASAEQTVQRGGRLGRPPALDPRLHEEVRAALLAGKSVSELARVMNVSRQTIMRIRD